MTRKKASGKRAREETPPTEIVSRTNADVSVSETGQARVTTQEQSAGLPRARPSVPERVQHIVGMMTRLEWVPGRSDSELGELWGMSASAVRNHSAEAHRVIKQAIGEPDELRAMLVASMLSVGRGALERTEEVAVSGFDKESGSWVQTVTVRKPDHRSALRSLESVRDTLGLSAPKKIEHSYADKSLDELLEEAARHLAKLQGASPANEETEHDDDSADGQKRIG